MKTSQVVNHGHMRRFWSTADMPVAPPIVPFPENLKLRYDASSEVDYDDNDLASTMTDFSGSSNNATPLSSYDPPVFKTGIMNSKPVFRFDGSSSVMVSATNSFTNTYTQHQTIAISYIPRDTSAAKRFFASSANSGEFCVFVARSNYDISNKPEVASGAAAVGQDVARYSGTISSGTPLVIIGVWNGSSVTYYQNGNLEETTSFTGTTTTASSNTRPWSIGAQVVNGFPDLPSQVDIGEIVVWNDSYTGGDIDEIYTYMANKWNP